MCIRDSLASLPGVTGVSPYIELTALAVHQPEMLPVLLRGIEPQAEARVADVRPLLVAGNLESLQPGRNAVIVGRDIADQLGLSVGDSLTLLVPMADASGLPEPRLREFHVGGVFEAGLEDLDNSLILARLEDVRAFAPRSQGTSGLRLRFNDALSVAHYMPAVRAAVGPGYRSSDWTEDNANYLSLIHI